MYFKDKDGRMWLQTDNGFQNIGVSVKEEIVTFKKIASVEIIPSLVVVPSIEGGNRKYDPRKLSRAVR